MRSWGGGLAIVGALVGPTTFWPGAADRPTTLLLRRAFASRHPGAAPKVTFLELGANSCVPCKEMKPVMKGIEQAFGDQVEVIFYDVWDDPAPANEYGIQMIPTQIFLDENGEEFRGPRASTSRPTSRRSWWSRASPSSPRSRARCSSRSSPA